MFMLYVLKVVLLINVRSSLPPSMRETPMKYFLLKYCIISKGNIKLFDVITLSLDNVKLCSNFSLNC